jgi:hypothetical protein
MSNGINKWDEELAKLATEAVAALPQASVNVLAVRAGGQLYYNDTPVPGSALDAIVLDFVRENQWYEFDYDPNKPGSPACYAYGTDPKTMTPHPDAPKPQCASCKDCPLNQFGTSKQGKGKACKNVLKLAVVPAGALDNLDEFASTEVAVMKVSVTSVSHFTDYATTLRDQLKRPPFAMVTKIQGGPDKKNQIRSDFSAVSAIEDGDALSAIMEKRKNVKLDTAYPVFEQEADAAPASAGRATRFSGSAKLGGRR